MPRLSAGILLHRRAGEDVEVLIAHMGGPFWAKKDEGGWSIPKGEYDEDETPIAAARREFAEELGAPAPDGEYLDLGRARVTSGKYLTVFAVEADFDADAISPGTFDMEWPPRSGRTESFPEVDRAAWFDRATAAAKLVKGQVVFLERLWERLAQPPTTSP
ncbi:NUDIX domain-containing protein [Phytomonospora endophytica]|uniref:Putative NUDIX family NTP pyrophosphohydrolase n=1 Tax=Phytomonospora endophytica TaxID=714109 RepID=A0A841FTL9_9ACTN|nr:NUDIX domain-containing protein [Phytomonospora endophytica]MBB6039675.1 putative NUDIX family NTP pyrophosphohydrolase [Phytomonospora endophytica]GIG65606.1 DNA mismatch repair protein MutT [Phytomonospora endophytica]